MEVEPHNTTIKKLVEGYRDDGEGGVVGYGGKLDIRPPYQREFVYDEKQRAAVINTVIEKRPLNVMYWAVRDDGSYEIIDGQQRTISIAQYIKGDFSFNGLYFDNLKHDQQKKIYEYELTVYTCNGSDSEKLEWFKTINIAGAVLTDQELRNAVYSGTWVTDAKRYFSRRECTAYKIGGDYMKGSAIRQEYLETAIKWISRNKIKNDIENDIKDYMGRHQHDSDSKDLKKYFKSVIEWIEKTFVVKRSKMKGVDWGTLYDQFKDAKLDAKKIEQETAKLIADDDVSNKAGIYPYILTRDEKHLSIRAFSDSVKQKTFEKQKGVCVKCRKKFKREEMEGDHVIPWSRGGKTMPENCQMLCKPCNARKSDK